MTCLFFLCLLFFSSANQQTPVSSPSSASQDVLAEFTASQSGSLIVNVPSQFTEDVFIRDKNLDLGNGIIRARNIILELLNGNGIQVVEDNEGARTIVNTDPGSAVETFRTIKIGDQTLTANSNEDELVFEADEGLELAIVDGKIVIKGASSSSGSGNSTTTIVESDSGFQDDGDTVSLTTSSDRVAVGTDVAEGKLHVETEASTVGMVIQSAAGQTANLAEWRDENGNPLIKFDKEGNAEFTGTITQDGSNISGDTIAFTGSGSTLTLDIKTEEPNNLLTNAKVDQNTTGWSTNTPGSTNHLINGEMQTSLDSN